MVDPLIEALKPKVCVCKHSADDHAPSHPMLDSPIPCWVEGCPCREYEPELRRLVESGGEQPSSRCEVCGEPSTYGRIYPVRQEWCEKHRPDSSRWYSHAQYVADIAAYADAADDCWPICTATPEMETYGKDMGCGHCGGVDPEWLTKCTMRRWTLDHPQLAIEILGKSEWADHTSAPGVRAWLSSVNRRSVNV